MPANPTTQEMGERHEDYLATVFGGTRTRASGSQWFDQGDVRTPHDEPYAFCVDGKSTLGKQIAVTRDMIAKIREQAQGEIPALGLRWYGNANLDQVDEDWAAVPAEVMEGLIAEARNWSSLVEWLRSSPEWPKVQDGTPAAVVVKGLVARSEALAGLRKSLADAHEALLAAGEKIAAQSLELETLRGQAESQAQVIAAQAVQHVPMLPWALIRMLPKTAGIGSAGDDSATVTAYAADGTLSTSRAKEVRVEHSADGHPKIFVDNVQVRDADLHDADGKHLVRACRSDPSIEVG